MKLLYSSLIILLALQIATGCRSKSTAGKESGNDTITVPDTGFTGIKKYMNGDRLAMESTFRNGIREGLTKTYYINGRIRSTVWYENGLKEDSARWFFEEGQLFRTTPYHRDTVDGIQKQYFRNGRLKANIGYKKGLRTFQFEEYDMNGRKLGGYPEMIIETKDDYNSKGVYRLILSLTDKTAKVKFYRGDFSNGIFDSTRAEKIKIINGKGILDLKKTGKQETGYVDILASIMSGYGNSYLTSKKVELPYKDIN